MNNEEFGDIASPKKQEVAVLGGGCFWCTEAVFSQINGVEKVEPGYSGGSLKIHLMSKSPRERQGTPKSWRSPLTLMRYLTGKFLKFSFQRTIPPC